MKESIHEELSALMDGELSAFELRRLLEQGMDAAALEKWRRWHRAQAVLQGELRTRTLSRGWSGLCHASQSTELCTRISAALASEALTPGNDAATSIRSGSLRWHAIWRPLGNVAVAASVSALVVLGWQSWQPAATLPPAAVASTHTASAGSFSSKTNSPVMPVSENAMAAQAVPARLARSSQDVIRLTDQQQDERLRLYFISHSGHAALNTASGPYSYARTVSIQPAVTK